MSRQAWLHQGESQCWLRATLGTAWGVGVDFLSPGSGITELLHSVYPSCNSTHSMWLFDSCLPPALVYLLRWVQALCLFLLPSVPPALVEGLWSNNVQYILGKRTGGWMVSEWGETRLGHCCSHVWALVLDFILLPCSLLCSLVFITQG